MSKKKTTAKKRAKRASKKAYLKRLKQPVYSSVKPYPGQVTKILDTSTERKRNLMSLYTVVIKSQEFLTGIEDEPRKSVFKHMLDISKKLAKVADAVDDYEVAEQKEIKRMLKQARKNQQIVSEMSSQLEQRAEGVLAQAKSTLDVTVKILKPLWNITLSTYGKGGSSVAKSLQNNVPEEFRSKISPLVDLVENDKNWIDAFKKYRDDQHFGNLDISVLQVSPDGDVVLPEMPHGQPVQIYLDIIYENLYSYVMDFMAAALWSRIAGSALGFKSEGEGHNRIFELAVDTSKLPPLPSETDQSTNP